jgi:UDP-GlcNAc:undecaprenyl-phosphate GlcNAc-1-phosphate transferase
MVRLLLVSALAGAIGTWLMRAIARRLGIVARPNPIVPQHRRPTAYLGGVGIGVGLAVATWVAGGAPRQMAAFAVPAAGFLALGLVDDLRPFRPIVKLALQCGLALLAALLGAARQPVTGIAVVDGALLAAWIVLLVNAVNVTDVCDGLVGGISAIALLFLGLWSAPVRPLAWGLAAACAGFLVFNRPPASIFMGDAGSHLLGYGLAVLSFPLLGEWPGALRAGAVVAPFLFEVALLTYTRTRRGRPFWVGSPDHFALRMQAAGLSRWRTVLLSWVGAALVGTLAARLPAGTPLLHAAFALGLGLAAWGFALWLLRHDVRDAAPRTSG